MLFRYSLYGIFPEFERYIFEIMKEITVSKNENGKKVFPFLCAHLPQAPGSILHKSIRNKNITVNGKKTDENYKLSEGDRVCVFFSDETFEKFSGNVEKDAYVSDIEKITDEILVLYEDDDILIVNKPAGVLSQKAKADDVSINEMVIAYLLRTGEITKDELKSFRPSVENRLDRNTSGIVLFGKSLKGMQELSKGLKERSIHKYYTAVVFGKLEKEGVFEGFLKKDDKTNKVTVSDKAFKDAQLIKTKICSYRYDDKLDITTLNIELLTGRTHQIRAYLSYMGHPIIGDLKYGNKNMKKFDVPYQLLHSNRVVIKDKGIDISAPIPAYYNL